MNLSIALRIPLWRDGFIPGRAAVSIAESIAVKRRRIKAPGRARGAPADTGADTGADT
ncbi:MULTISPECIES: hypothetical protein [Burkholderia]|uniref:hypothetical protein n=1 Tax=Burkholderia TaxID=32008 RepID=UPI00158E17C8|nr:hypothetical protein [Burkholderia ambifaria]